MKKICLNCNSIGKYKVPRELIETQLGWKLDLPPDGKRVWRQYGVADAYLCKECLLGTINLENYQKQVMI